MKHGLSVFTRQHIALIIFLFLAMLSLMFPISSAAGNETSLGDELISLTVKDEPLGDVLYKVSRATGYDISVDNQWQNYRVSASLEEVPLHKALKRILRNLNSAIIYVSSKKIKIIIYDKSASEGASYAPSAEKPLDRAPVSQHPSYRPWRERHPLPTSQDIEKEDSSETNEEPSDNTVVSDQESETSAPDSEGEGKTKPESVESGSNERTNKDLEGKSSDESSENDNQTESNLKGE